MNTILILALLLVSTSLAACTAEQAYYSGQGWQRNQCNKAPDKTESDRCLENANTPYDSYKRQSESDRK